MSKVEYSICDRCGEKLKPYLFTNVSRHYKRHRILEQWTNRNCIDSEFDLCEKCSDELDKFLHNKGELNHAE